MKKPPNGIDSSGVQDMRVDIYYIRSVLSPERFGPQSAVLAPSAPVWHGILQSPLPFQFSKNEF